MLGFTSCPLLFMITLIRIAIYWFKGMQLQQYLRQECFQEFGNVDPICGMLKMVKSDEDVNLEYRMILLSLSESIIPSARISMRSLVIHLHERGCIILFHPSPIYPYFRLPLKEQALSMSMEQLEVDFAGITITAIIINSSC